MTIPIIEQPIKRRLLKIIALLPSVTACAAARSTSEEQVLRRFKGIPLILVVDAVRGAELREVTFFNDRGYVIYASSLVAKRNREIMALGNPRIPLTVRVIWREGAGWDAVQKVWNEGTIAGDYPIPIADRIPDAVVADIRQRRGGLRLKFRLKPDGVLFGWDIERPDGGLSRFDMPGGDFLETRY